MTLKIKEFETLPVLLAELENLALEDRDIVFRGHREASWKIKTTYARYTTRAHEFWDSSIDEMLSHFINNALTIGELPFGLKDRRARLEYGRHHGVPTPVVDYTYSPYVALYFAFEGIQYKHDQETNPDAAIYALDVQQLATAWARLATASPSCDPEPDHSENQKAFGKVYDDFMLENSAYFDNGYPASDLKFIAFCASWNTRMRNQLGCFIYDTLDYQPRGVGQGDFEAWVDTLKEPDGPDDDRPILTKYLIPHSEVGRVFARLELMNITGTKLLDSAGLAADVKHAYNYNMKAIGYSWDTFVPPPRR